jgi:eukaryotic-like serine/threonine-protein kinase
LPLSTDQVVNQRYRVLRLLGKGGFGSVYLARDQRLDRDCALKENLETSAETIRQFEREAQLLASLNHPNLPRVTDHFQIPEQGQYLVMDYIEGEDLEHLLRREGHALAERAVIDWAGQICEALSYLHQHQPPIIHRDIKPANIRITPRGQAVLVDFGVAKVYTPSGHTTIGARAVTPGFSPPEQYGRGDTDARSDIYALGATLYFLLTTCIPAESIDLLAGNVPPLRPARALSPLVSERVSAAISQAMQPGKPGRFESAAAFRNALLGNPSHKATLLAGEPVSAAGGAAGGKPAAGSTVQGAEAGRVPAGAAVIANAAAVPAPGGSCGPPVGKSKPPPVAAPRPPSVPRAARRSRLTLSVWQMLVYGMLVGSLGLVVVLSGLWGFSRLGRQSPPPPASESLLGRGTAPVMAHEPSETRPPASPVISSTRTSMAPSPPVGMVAVNLPAARLAFVSDHLQNGQERIFVQELRGGDYWYCKDTGAFMLPADPPREVIDPFRPLQAIPADSAYDMAWWPEWCAGDNLILFEAQQMANEEQQTVMAVTYTPGGVIEQPRALNWSGFKMLGVPRCPAQGNQALLSALNSAPGSTWELYSFGLDNPWHGQPVQDGFPFAGNASWSHDGSVVVFMHRQANEAVFNLVTFPWANPTTFTTLARPDGVVDAKYPAISPKNGAIAYACSNKQFWGLCLMDRQGQHLGILQSQLAAVNTLRPSPKRMAPPVTPSWSPDGQWLAYASNKDGDWDIYLFNPELQLEINLTADLVGDQFEPAWSKFENPDAP